MQIAQRSVPLHHYLKQPRRLVHALMNPSQVDQLSRDTFRFRLRGFQFLMLNIRPVVDLQIDASEDHVLRVRSVGCKIQGNDFVNKQFALKLTGILRLTERTGYTQLTGNVKLDIAVGLPPMLQLTPYSILETTGNQILKGVLMTIKQRLMRQLAADYECWSEQQPALVTSDFALGTQS